MVKIGIVGAGIIASEHAAAISKRNDCKLTMVADLDIERAKKTAEPQGAEYFTDYKDFLNGEAEKPDAVILNLPHFLHCEAAVYFMSHGVNVLVEKPMAMSVEECDRMITVAKEYNVKLAVGHVQQYTKAHSVIKSIVENGDFGRLTRITELRNIDYFTNRPAWFLDKKLSGGGIVMNYCAHTLDKIFYITSADIEEIHANLSNYANDFTVEEGAQIIARLSNGASVSVTYCGGKVPNEYETKFYFTNGAAMVKNGTVLYFHQNGEWEKVELEQESAFDRQLSAFIDLLDGKESIVTKAETGRKIIAAIEQIYSEGVMR